MTHPHTIASAVAEILSRIEATADASYAHFCGVRTRCSSDPTTVLGIRMKPLREAMKALPSAGMDLEMAHAVLLPLARKHYEYKILYGGVIQRVCPHVIEMVERELDTLLSLCDGWATCDYFTEVFAHFARKGFADTVLRRLEHATRAPNPFARRLSVVVMIRLHRLGVVTVAEAIDRCDMMQDDDDYYIQMGIAWVLAEMYVHDSPSVHLYMQHGLREEAIRRMLIRKLKDSYRVEDY